MKNRALPMLSTLVAGLALASPAHAVAGFGMLPAALTAAIRVPAGAQATAPCSLLSPAGGTAAPAISPYSKTTVLLGGAPSQLELIARQQGATSSAGLVTPAASMLGLMGQTGGCSAPAGLVAARPAFAGPGPGSSVLPVAPAIAAALPARPFGPDDFLSSRRLAVSRTSFDGQWARVSRAGLSSGLAQGLASMPAQGDRMARITAINAWTNGHVRYAEDAALYRKADYWADARTTLRARAGDCEDIAILKMQLLIAAGIPRDAIFLTIARDLARRADHAMLVVREGDRYWLLDNATNAVIDANTAPDYRPIFSYGQQGKWLHGY